MNVHAARDKALAYTKPEIPPDEDKRLRRLKALDLDEEPDERFDAVVEAARRAFDVPIALVSIVDFDRQWFKARCGLDAKETSRDVSFCGHAITSEAPVFVIPDATRDERFARNPLVIGEPNIRFYAGAPIHGPGGSAIGTICLIDRQARSFSQEEEEILIGFARWVEAEVLAHAMNREKISDLATVTSHEDGTQMLSRAKMWDLTQDMVCIANLDGYFEDLNSRFTQVLGIGRTEMMARPFADNIHPDDLKSTEMEMAKLGQGIPSVQFRNRYRAADGTYRWFEWAATPADGLLYATARDVTQMVGQESALEEARTALEARNKELNEFTSAVSHDMQEPLRKVTAFAERIQARVGDAADEKTTYYIERMVLATQRMRALIESLLAYSRLSSRRPEIVVLDPQVVIREVLEDLGEAVKESGAVVNVGLLPLIRLDPTHARQLFQNLIGNAIKYQPEGQAPIVSISGHEETGRAHLEVRDNGIGFDHEYVESIFRPFQRLHGKDEYAGSGMGLAICQKIVENNGGTISANGDNGATFRFDLPGVTE